ncbi:hypothetical protein EC957_010770 [Mortierella hygrophila]|uniref:Uncharacterized protein n=1 Tax=Mortierella hygrophila TaxID=979708 RepID=A0A9P6FIJ6_9FUNG|nr:hypothetical protein EC957_010770 [Mortierella hygrophila]
MIVTEIKIVGAEVRALVCSGSRLRTTDSAYISCAYTIANVLIIKPGPFNPDILLRQPVSTDEPSFTTPNIIAAAYFASLRLNFILDWESSTLYVAYD